jgi:hypothetical protein
MARFAAAVLLPLAFGCGGGDGAGSDGGPGDGGANADADVPVAVDPSNRFAAQAEDLSVPESGSAEGFNQPSSYTSYRYWTMLDLDGDDRPDIAQTGDTELTQSVWDAGGSPYWKVFAGGAAGWAESPIEWELPDSGTPAGFFASDVTGGGEWRTMDLTGDGVPDLIQTGDPQAGTVWDEGGDPHWKLFEGDGAGGFDTSPRAWPVPDSGTIYGFETASSATSSWQWITVDVTGDRKPDLIQTADPATGYVWDASGSPHWKVFENTGAGFRAQPMQWEVPDSGTTAGFFAARSVSGARWDLLDLDGDGRADLVQTSDPATAEIVWDASGEPYWKVFAGTGEGFDPDPVQWRVPDSGLADGFYAVEGAGASRYWSVLDIDGDRDLDLVQSGDVSHSYRVWDATGDPYWKVYRNQRDGFSLDLHRWPVPESGSAEGFYLVRGDGSWFTGDVDGDGRADLVQTQDPATARVWDATGSPYWKVFRGED